MLTIRTGKKLKNIQQNKTFFIAEMKKKNRKEKIGQ